MQIDTTSEFGRRVMRQLEGDQVIWLTTVGADGTPYPSPVWFFWQDDQLLIYSQPDAPKVRNIAARPKVALNFNCDFHGHEVVSFSGIAQIDPAAPPADQVPAYRAKYAEGIVGLEMTPERFAAAYSTAIRVVLTRLRGF